MLFYAANTLASIIAFAIFYYLWYRFKPLTPDEQKIFDCFNIALQNSERAHVEYTTWHNREGEYRVRILDREAMVVSNKLGAILKKIHSEHWDKIHKAEHLGFVDAIYAELTKKYPATETRIENGSFKGSKPTSPRPNAPQPPVLSEEKQAVASKTLYDM